MTTATSSYIERTPLIKNNTVFDDPSSILNVRSSLDEFDFASPEDVPFVPPLQDDPFQLMETGNLSWCRPQQQQQQHVSNSTFGTPPHPHNMRDAVLAAQPSTGSTASLPSNDPRKSIHHKRHDLTTATDTSSSLGTIDFSELQLTEVIGGGGFGQVWRATWRGTPIAVKVLTGAAQSQRVPRSVLEEFAAELNVLSGCRHPNVCLYMGACLAPPHRAIVTELAVNGSVWDALRLPLAAPYTTTTTNVVWPAALWKPDAKHGSPPRLTTTTTSVPRVTLPSHLWPWPLVLRVARGTARGMAYLHSGRPPVVHRDLKSANVLLDESYTPKVCDFGLSRLQSSSMTGNCGTVQWMAPEVLANQSYTTTADVFSYGIILWELLTAKCPYESMTPIQCALAVLNKQQRPDIPAWCPPALHALIRKCVKQEPTERPSFEEILELLDQLPQGTTT